MEENVLNLIETYNLKTENYVICATSGGADSVAMIYLLNKFGFKCVLAHVNHHKRIESETEQKAMEEYAKQLNVPFELLSYHYDGTDNFHNDSHYARYDFFKSLCQKYNTNVIATAHHLDDQIETILMKIMEGSNLYGYGGISIINDDGNYKIIRPLLSVSKDEIYAYCKEKHLTYFEDQSNHEDGFLRNRLRHHVVPLLKEECPSLYKKVFQYSLQVKEAFNYIRKDSIAYLKNHNNAITISDFTPLDIALKKDIISLMLENEEIVKNNRIINDILIFLTDNNGNKKLMLNGGFCFKREYDRAFLEKDLEKNIELVSLAIDDDVLFAGKYRFYFSKNIPTNNEKYIKLCYNELNMPFSVRKRQDGDAIVMPYGEKKLSRLFIDAKLSKEQRDFTPVVTDSKNNILWVYDIAKAKSVYQMKETGNIYLICEVLK